MLIYLLDERRYLTVADDDGGAALEVVPLGGQVLLTTQTSRGMMPYRVVERITDPRRGPYLVLMAELRSKTQAPDELTAPDRRFLRALHIACDANEDQDTDV